MMQAFTTLAGIAAALRLADVDTDQIMPGRYLKTVKRTGLGAALFADIRFDPSGREDPDFVLNRTPYRNASILIALENFGIRCNQGTVVHAAARSGDGPVRISHPLGTLESDAVVHDGRVDRAALGRTARLLMRGTAFVHGV